MKAHPHTTPYAEDELSVPIRILKVSVLGGPGRPVSSVTERERIQVGSDPSNDLVLDDDGVSRFHLQLSRGDGGILVEDHGSTNGTFVGHVRVERALVPPGTEVRVGRTLLVVEDGSPGAVEIRGGVELAALIGASPSMRRLCDQVRTAAASEVAVHLLGESGTGKELVAHSLHSQSARADGPFVVVDCAALSPTLIASELFGHEKGAFTGASRQHAGAFERAAGGTLFLDEIGDLPLALQPNLLGVLERRSFRRLGGAQEITSDVRVVSATSRDLRADVNSGAFRLDLYYRIAVVRLALPSLREREGDVLLLIRHFLRELGESRDLERVLSPETIGRVLQHPWPGNVRELRNFVEATVAMGETPALTDEERATEEAGELVPDLDSSYKKARTAMLSEFEKGYLAHALKRAEGNVSKAARECGMDRSHLWDLVRRHGLR